MPNQKSTFEQLQDAFALCNKNGLYDAADAIFKNFLEKAQKAEAEQKKPKGPKIHILNDHPSGLEEKVQGASEVWVDYENDGYGGGGRILTRVGRRYFIDSLGHCSCYGPLDDYCVESEDRGRTLAQLKKNCSEELLTELKPIFEVMGV